MSAVIGLSRENAVEKWLRAEIQKHLRKFRSTPAEISSAVAEGKRWLSFGHSLDSSVAHAMKWALGGPKEPQFPPPAA